MYNIINRLVVYTYSVCFIFSWSHIMFRQIKCLFSTWKIGIVFSQIYWIQIKYKIYGAYNSKNILFYLQVLIRIPTLSIWISNGMMPLYLRTESIAVVQLTSWDHLNVLLVYCTRILFMSAIHYNCILFAFSQIKLPILLFIIRLFMRRKKT